jgi:hypothetical protein
MRRLARAVALVMAGFGLLATGGLVQALLRPQGAETWFIMGLSLVAVSSGAFALAAWKMS